MNSTYRLTVNLEITSKCNAKCRMCPRDAIIRPQLMNPATFHRAMNRIKADDVARVVVAGFGEPSTHPLFSEFLTAMGEHPVRFDVVTNGQQLNEDLLKRIDGRLGLLMISFSSIDRNTYESVHQNLDYDRVTRNITLAGKILRKTQLAISLSPVREALATIDETIGWLRRQGINGLTMSPTLYNRAGADPALDLHTAALRNTIEKHCLHSQELDFITALPDFLGQWRANRVKCVARNTVLFISAGGAYLNCFNDIAHEYPVGAIGEMSVRQALHERERSGRVGKLCDGCNLAGRYRPREVFQVAIDHGRRKLIAALRVGGDYWPNSRSWN